MNLISMHNDLDFWPFLALEAFCPHKNLSVRCDWYLADCTSDKMLLDLKETMQFISTYIECHFQQNSNKTPGLSILNDNAI